MELKVLTNIDTLCGNKLKDIINQTYNIYRIDPYRIIQNYKEKHSYLHIEFPENVFGAERLYKVRKSMIKNILSYTIKGLHLTNEKVKTCLFDCIFTDSNPLSYDEYISLRCDGSVHQSISIFSVFLPPFVCFNKKKLNLYFVTDKNRVYYYSNYLDNTFAEAIIKNDNINDAIIECNYFADRNRIVTLANF